MFFHMTANLVAAFFSSDVFLHIERVSASFYQMVCIYKRTVLFFWGFFSQQTTHNLAFLVHLAVLSVGGVRE